MRFGETFMTKKELQNQLKLAISQKEWEQIQRGDLSVSDFNRSVLLEMKESDAEDEEGFVDEQLAKELSDVLEREFSQSLSEKQTWRYEIIGSLYLTYLAKRPVHSIEELEIRVTEGKEGHTYECPKKSSKRDTSCYFCVCRKLSNYEIAKRKTQKQFYQYNHEEISEKLHIPLEDGYLYLEFLSRNYRVHCQTGYVEWSEDDFAHVKEADYNEVMILYDILCYSQKNAAPSNEFTLIQRLSNVQNAASYAGKGAFKKEEAFLDGKTATLAKALEKLNGKPYGKGDVSFRLPVFRSLDVIVSFWNSDEDFPAQIKFLCDRNILQYMHYETVWYLTSHIMQRIKELMEET